MAFNDQYWGRVSYGNNGDVTINYSTGVGTQEGPCNIWSYNGNVVGDNIATIGAGNYFLPVVQDLQLNDLIYATATDTPELLQVSAITYPNSQGTGAAVTTVSFDLATVAPNSITTAMIQNAAVTFPKIQNVNATALMGNPTGAPAAPSNITLAGPLSFAGTTLTIAAGAITGAEIGAAQITNTNLAVGLPNFASGVLTSAQFKGMEAAPVQLLAAQGANTLIIVHDFVLELVFVSAQYANGGAVGLEYGNTAALAGPAASLTIPAASFTGAAASSVMGGGFSLPVATVANAVNKGIFISNDTAPYITGDSTFNWYMVYSVVATT